MKKLIFFVFIFVISISSYGQRNRTKRSTIVADIPTYDLTHLWEAKENALLSDIAESIEYFPLEMTKNPQSTLSGAMKISITVSNDHFLLYDLDKSISLFSSEGKFLRVIGSRGKGPGEYLSVKGLRFSEDEQSIWILDSEQNRLINYDFNNQLINSLQINPRGFYFNVIGDKIYLICIASYHKKNDENVLEVLDLSGNLLESIPLYENRQEGPGQVIGFTTKLSKVGAKIVNFETPYDTVFELVESKRWKPIAAFNHGPDQIPIDIFETNTFNEKFREYAVVKRTLENSGFYFIDGIYKQMTTRLLVNKTTKEVKKCNYIIKDLAFAWVHTGLKNDIDGLISFWPKATYHDNTLYTIIDSWMILEYARKNGISLSDKLSKISNDSNPVIMKVVLKDL